MKKTLQCFSALIFFTIYRLMVFLPNVNAHVIPTVTHNLVLDMSSPGLVKFSVSYVFDIPVVSRFIGEFDTNSDKAISDAEKNQWIKNIKSTIDWKVGNQSVHFQSPSVTIPAWPDFFTGIPQVVLAEEIPITFDCKDKPQITITDNKRFLSYQDDIYTIEFIKPLCAKQANILQNQNKTSIDLESKSAPIKTQTSSISRLTDRLNQSTLSPLALAILLALSVFLGALHALTPGHGKTLVAAYLVGQRSTSKDAVILGLVTTITHTAVIYILGILSLIAAKFLMLEKIIPLVEGISALLIFTLGLYLVRSKWHELHHGHDHTHTHDDIPSLKGKSLSLGSILVMGFSGGLVPCMDALAILLIAINLNKIVLGLILVLMFSLGLASVLVGGGLVLVRSKKLFEKIIPHGRLTAYFPLVSAIIVLLAGVVMLFRAMKIF